MKKLLLLFLFIPILSFTQNNHFAFSYDLGMMKTSGNIRMSGTGHTIKSTSINTLNHSIVTYYYFALSPKFKIAPLIVYSYNDIKYDSSDPSLSIDSKLKKITAQVFQSDFYYGASLDFKIGWASRFGFSLDAYSGFNTGSNTGIFYKPSFKYDLIDKLSIMAGYTHIAAFDNSGVGLSSGGFHIGAIFKL